MKKALFVIVLLVAVLAVNAQTVPAKTTVKKADMSMVSSQDAVRVAVDVADLLKPITDNITKDFAGYTIEEATSVTLSSIVTYEVVVVNETEKETLLYDKDGLFLKKMEKVI
jgi:hypothetical protein